MTRQIVAAAALALALPLAAAWADEPKPAPPAAPSAPGKPPEGVPEKPAGVVKLEIEESLDGKPSRDTPITHMLRKKLREAGFVAWTVKPLRSDEVEKRKREREAKESKTPAPASPTADINDYKPAPDLVIKGTIEVGVGSTSTFYGQTVATMYVGQGNLSIRDAGGKELAQVVDEDEWGKTDARKARDESIQRFQSFLAAGVLKSEPVRSRIAEKHRPIIDQYIERIEKKRKETAPQDGKAPGEGEPEGKKGESEGKK